jgi:hypothetical protein
MMLYSTSQMLKKVTTANGECIECKKIINNNFYSTYFIFWRKTFKNGKSSFSVEYDCGEQVWTNKNFISFLNDDLWYIVD